MRELLLAGRMSAALLLTAACTGPAAATLNQSWNGWRWSRTGNLELKVGNNLSAAWQPFLSAAISQWNADPVIDFVSMPGNGSSGTACNATYGTIQVCNASYGFNGWLGYAYVWTSASRIVQATIKLNDSYFAAARYNKDSWRAMTMCHELGHTLGLNHADNTRTNANIGSCLDLTNDPSGYALANGPLANMQPGANDFQWLQTIYATTDTSQLPSTRVTVAGSALAVPEPSAWAMLITGFGIVGAAKRRRRLMHVTSST